MAGVTIISVSLSFEELNNFLAAVSWLLHKFSYFNTTDTKYFTILYLLAHHVFFKTTHYLLHRNTIRIPLRAAHDWIVVRPAQYFQDQLKKNSSFMPSRLPSLYIHLRQHHLSAGCCLRNCNYNRFYKLFNEDFRLLRIHLGIFLHLELHVH